MTVQQEHKIVISRDDVSLLTCYVKICCCLCILGCFDVVLVACWKIGSSLSKRREEKQKPLARANGVKENVFVISRDEIR